MKYALVLFALFQVGCASGEKIKFDLSLIRPWEESLENESHRDSWIAHHKNGSIELYYLAANHSNDPKGITIKLVQQLFDRYQFNVLIIEPISFAEGESPYWFVEDSKKGISADLVKGAEPAVAAVLAHDKKIPFYGGEPTDAEVAKEILKNGFNHLDLMGFYLLRIIPQWNNQKMDRKTMLEKFPKFLNYFCKKMDITTCPSFSEIKNWYSAKMQKPFKTDFDPMDVAPMKGSPLYTHQISTAINRIRDRHTLKVIETFIQSHKKVAVVYGSSHYISLKKSLEKSLGTGTVTFLTR